MHFRGIATQAVLASNITTGSGRHVSLSDVKWTLSSSALNSTVPASLPSQAHLDLLNAGVIGKLVRLVNFSVSLTKKTIRRF
jgi:beta-mannosidase